MSLFIELKRRNVFRVGIAYVIATWLLLQAIDFALDVIGAPNWIMQVLVLLGVLGLPAVLAFAWVFEMTPEGLKRESDIQQEQSVTNHTAKKLDKLTIALLIAVVVIVIADRFVPQQGEATPAVTQASVNKSSDETSQPAKTNKSRSETPSLAVLPFTNMSSDPDNEYFSDGISEELLNLLVQVKGLRVPSRTSSFAFKGRNMDIKEIARQLAVEHILEGSVRKAGDQVRITAQLIDVSTDTHLWSQTYDRKLENIFALQDEISRDIVQQLKIALDTSGLVSREETRPTDDMQAYQDYLRGHFLFIQRGTTSLKASLEALQSAVDRDPDFVEAWASLSQTAATLSGWDPTNASSYNQMALDAGNHALKLDKTSATALTGLGLRSYNMTKWSSALDYLEQASGLSKDSNPTYFYGIALQATGYLSQARQALTKAEAMDPVYPQLQQYLGLSAMTRGDLAAARVHFQRAIDGGNANGPYGMYWVALSEGDIDDAVGYLRDMADLSETDTDNRYPRNAMERIAAALYDPELLADGIQAAIETGNIISLSHFGAATEIMQYLKNDFVTRSNAPVVVFVLGNMLWAPEFSGLRQLPEYKQFLTDVGLVKLWQARGWPDLCKPVGKDDFKCK